MTVVTEEEIRSYNYSSVDEVLRKVPGVEVQRSGGLGKTSQIKMRGAGADQVLILVDGLRVASPTLGTADLSELSLDAIERIEVVRGPQSTLYGADAIGGVINIITRKGQGPPQGMLWGEVGTYETFRERASVQGALGRFNYAFSESHYDTRGYIRRFDNDDATQTALAGRIGYDFPWKGDLSLSVRYSKTDLDLPINSTFPLVILDPNQRQQTETYLFNLAYKQPIVDWWRISGRWGQWWNNQGYEQGVAGKTIVTAMPTISQIDTFRREFELVNAFDMGKWSTLTAGFEHRQEHGENRRVTRQTINVFAGFLQEELRFFDRLFLSGGARAEDNDSFGSAITPRAAVAFNVKETGTRLRASWGKGFRAPTINDLFFPGFGNPLLKPERSESYDVGFDQRLFANRVRFGGTYFHNEFTQLIQFILDPATFSFQPENVGRAQSEGIESYLEIDPLDWLLLYANHTYTHAIDRVSHLELRRFPHQRFNAGAQVTPISRLTVFVQGTGVTKQFEGEDQGYNPGWYRVDAGGTLRLADRVGILHKLELTLRMENLTGNRYHEVQGFRAAGFSGLLGLRAFFQ
ncbi:MAG: TonB-dependent receptor [Candidatus Rokubacteria bacterium]|nr:TonB-dependent receptor [Candidatus Rokubacteria bacterium]MBI3824483.1 TonB-dependent receptor [Candidatus Rokubacteria bacterium]